MNPVAFTLLASLVLLSACGLETIPAVRNPAATRLEAVLQQHPEAPLLYLWEASSADFHKQRSPSPVRFQGVRFGYIVQRDGSRMYLLSGRFLPQDAPKDGPWVPFLTLKTEGYEQWLGAMAKAHASEHKIHWLPSGDLSEALLQKLQSLRR